MRHSYNKRLRGKCSLRDVGWGLSLRVAGSARKAHRSREDGSGRGSEADNISASREKVLFRGRCDLVGGKFPKGEASRARSAGSSTELKRRASWAEPNLSIEGKRKA